MNRDYRAPIPARPNPEVEFFYRWDPAADLQALYAGFQVCPAGHSWKGRRTHALVHHVLSGAGRVRFGGREWALGPGDSFLFPPQTDLWYEADRRDPWRYLWVGFGGARVVPWLEACGLGGDRLVVRTAPGNQGSLVFIDLLEALEKATQGTLSAAGVQARLFALLDHLAEGPAEAGPSHRLETPYVQEIVEFLGQAYSRRLTTATIARFAGLERTYCCDLFSKTLGTPLMQYLAELRMDKAVELLHSTALSVRDVAESVGYSDAGVFSKRFKAIKGMSPSQARSGFGSP